MFAAELKLDISPKSVQTYVQLAHKHLQRLRATLDVEMAGLDEAGQAIYGICLRSHDGQEEWYDPHELGEGTMAGWDEEESAKEVLEMKVLPNLGYSIHQKELQRFHQNMVTTDE